MASPRLILILLYVVCLSIGSFLGPWYQNWSGERNNSRNYLSLMMGDSRTALANVFFAKADAYFHKGYYPSIFDTPKKEDASHMTAVHSEKSESEPHEAAHEHHDEESEGFLEPPKDWIDRFGRNFFPSHHSHLENGGEEREILPWLDLSAELDPQRVETYTIASYWLRRRLGKVDEAENFLRQGLRANPESYEIYFELGRIYDEDRHEPKIARNIWEVALRKWKSQQEKSASENNPGLKPDGLVYEGIVGNLARLEEAEGNFDRAIYYFELLKKTSPVPDQIQKQIDELRAKSINHPKD